jgi:hypothetical protein
MRQILSGLGSVLFLMAALGASQTATAQIVDDTAASAPAPASEAVAPESQQGAVQQAPTAQPAPVDAVMAQEGQVGDVADLQRLIKGSELTEFRTSYNGSFGASLLYYNKEQTYYVALFQQKSFWRVVKTQSAARADAVFNDFVKQTVQLSQIEIRRTEIEAQKGYTEKMISLAQARAARLQADLNVAHSQKDLVAARLKASAQQAAQLEAEREAAQQQLQELRRHVADLQQQNDAGLPKTRQH